ncbi:MAG: DNA replication/repair protein RecF [Alphaproteobacteria bacterium]|nr:DNA replication/repair protein RecF [Alphaproteobacteria bacterium]
MITGLRLHNFRNMGQVSLHTSKKCVVLWGENGSGKTNILEAISLFSHSKGLRQDAHTNMINQAAPHLGWGVHIDLEQNLTFHSAYKPQLDGDFKRISSISEQPIKSTAQFQEWMNLLWMTPQTDQLFADSPSKRRKFVDRFVYAKDPLHLKRVLNFEQAVRQRLKLLKQERYPNHEWLTALEQTIAQEGVAIGFARSHVLKTLSTFQPLGAEEGILTSFTACMDGPFEMHLTNGSALQIEESYRKALAENRTQDQQSGMTLLGPHRSDLSVMHHRKNMNAFCCSTGEQKILLLSLLISFMEQVSFHQDQLTVFILDDAMAHLDTHHRSALFHRLIQSQDKNFQIWFSGTDQHLFQSLESVGEYIYVPSLMHHP